MSANNSISSSSADQQQQKITIAYTNQPCRRKLQFVNGKFAVQKPQTSTVQKRNERERSRVKLINRTFTILRDRLPPKYSGKKERKLSKVEVLKTATSYIAYLVRLLEEDDSRRRAAASSGGSDQPQHQNQQTGSLYQAQSQSVTSLLSPCGDLADLLNDDSLQVVHSNQAQQQQQQPPPPPPPLPRVPVAETRHVEPISSEDEDPESGIFQLSNNADFSSSGSLVQQLQSQQQQPLMSHLQLLPVVPPAVSTSCAIAVSTPIKPMLAEVGFTTGSASSSGASSSIELIGPTFFYPVTTAATFTSGSLDCSTIGDSQELQFLTISDLSESYASFYQYF